MGGSFHGWGGEREAIMSNTSDCNSISGLSRCSKRFYHVWLVLVEKRKGFKKKKYADQM